MRKIALFLLVIVAFASCKSEEAKVDSMSAADSANKEAYPYIASYSSKFEIGDDKYSHTILKMWKAWDAGDLNSVKDMFADSVVMMLANGWVDSGTRDSVVAHAIAYRSTLDSVSSKVIAFVPLKSVDKDEQWVSIWGTEVFKDKKGKIDSVHMQESWRLDKNGKINLMLQHTRAATPPKM